jgi:N-acetylglucosaminyldiphosphoundecaprenol N-acetyl-beta-D-mannosaminyltransferase
MSIDDHLSKVLVFGGLELTPIDLDQAIQRIARSDSAIAVHLVNAHTVSIASKDATYRDVLNSRESLNLIDSRWLSRASSQLSNRGVPQVRGPRLFRSILAESTKKSFGIFLLGGSEELLEKISSKATEEFPSIKILGTCSPPFRTLTLAEEGEILEQIEASMARIVLVGLGTPNQDLWVQKIVDHSGTTAVALGAAFDFYGGTKPEAHPILSRMGLEWLFRLATEPKRLWKRYLFGNLSFLRIWASELRKK